MIRKTHKLIMSPDPFTGHSWDDQIIFDRRMYGDIQVTAPVEVHYLPHGAINNGPSVAFVSVDLNDNFYLGQISVEMLNRGLKDIGYKVVKIE